MKRIAAAAGLLVALLALLAAPRPHRLSDDRAGDAPLAGRVADVIGGNTTGYRGLSVAFVDRGRVSSAVLGDAAGGPLFEIGSVQKTMTGMLLADLAAAGEVDPQDTLGETLGITGEAASITLEELASQRSGLPRLAPGVVNLVWNQLRDLGGRDPYGGADAGAVAEQARSAEPGGGRGEIGYSNFGMALLGQALAARTGTPYPQLVTERILRPLGMASTHPLPPAPPPAGLAGGSTAAGAATLRWVSSGYAPAGIGAVSTAEDLAKLVSATAAGTAPGAVAATPRFRSGDEQIGYAWFTDRYGDREITWHNGGTNGFRSFVGFDRATGQGVVVLGNTDRDVEWIGIRLLGGEAPRSAETAFPGWYRLGATALLLLWAAMALPLLGFRRAGAGGVWFPAPDRLRAVGAVLSTAALLLFVHRIGVWLTLPWQLWAVAAGCAAAGLAALVRRWRSLPTIASGGRRARWVQFGLSAAISVGLFGLLL